MRALLQRVSRARVRVDGETCGAIEGGLLVLAGVAATDDADDVAWLADRIAALRIFPDAGGKMNLPVGAAGAAVLLVSQFTLHADASKGRRPSFARAARPEQAVPLLDALQRGLEERGLAVPTGRFGAHMEVELVNDGPVTILLDSADRARAGGPGPEARARQRFLADDASWRDRPFVLASASPRRHALLEGLGVRFTVEPADIDESHDLPEDPAEQACVLARRKAGVVAARHADAIVVGADTIVVLDGRVYGKPRTGKEAVRMLTELSGREHVVHTGVAAVDASAGVEAVTVVSTRVRFHRLAADEIRRYVATGEPMDKAGAYALQGRGALLVAGIDGDYTNVVGLPVGALVDLLDGVLAAR